jgi:hypothetical protein
MRLVPGQARFVLFGVAAMLACDGQISPEPRVNVGGRSNGPELRPEDEPRPDAGAGGASGAGRGGAPAASDPDDGDNEREDAGTVTSGEPGGESGPFCDAVTQVLLPRCGGGSCHSNPNARIGDFAAGRAEAESFVDVPSVRNASCGFVIDSRDPSQSLLLRKLIGDYPIPTCGGPMPVSGGDLTDEQIECMGSWLEQFRAE